MHQIIKQFTLSHDHKGADWGEQYIKHVSEAEAQLGLIKLAALARGMGEAYESLNMQI